MTIFSLYNQLTRFPLGHWLFSKAICLKAPYFASIHPQITTLKPGCCEVKIDKRRAHRNHIGTVHAIAICNMAELAAGLATDVSLPKHLRWIPKSMQVNYLKKAETTLVAQCQIKDELQVGEYLAHVDVKDIHDNLVFTAEITMYLSER